MKKIEKVSENKFKITKEEEVSEMDILRRINNIKKIITELEDKKKKLSNELKNLELLEVDESKYLNRGIFKLDKSKKVS